MNNTLYTGTAGRRTFVRETDEGRLIVYSVAVGEQRQERFCTRAEWDDWCDEHAPLTAKPGLCVSSASHQVVVVDVDEATDVVEVSLTTIKWMSKVNADRLVQRVAREGRAEAEKAERIQEETVADFDASAHEAVG